MSDEQQREGPSPSSSALGTIAFLVFILAAGVAAWIYIRPYFVARSEDRERTRAAESLRENEVKRLPLRVCSDDFIGNWFFRSTDLTLISREHNINVQYIEDSGDVSDRVARLERGECDIANMPIGSYLEHGRLRNYPGLVVWGIDQSVGADGLVGFTDKFPKGMVNELDFAGAKIGFIPGSPSEAIAHIMIQDFGLTHLQKDKSWAVPFATPRELLAALREGKITAAILWEPWISIAMRDLPKLKYIWGTDQLRGYVVDFAVFSRKFLLEHAIEAAIFSDLYFQVVGAYANDRPRLIDEMSRSALIDPAIVEKLIPSETSPGRIQWYDRRENATQLFGIATMPGEKVVRGIDRIIVDNVRLFQRTGALPEDPLEGNTGRIVTTSIMEELVRTAGKARNGSIPRVTVNFPQLSDEQWEKLPDDGVLKVASVKFKPGTTELTTEGEQVLAEYADLIINHYQNSRFEIQGHTAPGDEEANRVLSQERADAIVRRLVDGHGVNPNRLRAVGLGSTKPFPQGTDESNRAYTARLSRVQFHLKKGNSL